MPYSLNEGVAYGGDSEKCFFLSEEGEEANLIPQRRQ